MSAEVKKLFALSMEAAAKLETLDREEAELMAAASIQPPNAPAAADAVALAASGKRTSCFFWVFFIRLTAARLHGPHSISRVQLIQGCSNSPVTA